MKRNFNTILKGITRQSLAPIYFIHGKEPYFSALIVDRIIELAIPVTQKSFNEQILYGKDIQIGDVINAARRYPMMAERQLIVVKNADDIQDLNVKESSELLKSYFENPLRSTVLVLHFNVAIDERKAYVKALMQHGFVFKSNPLYDNELPDFIHEFCKSKGANISLKAAHLLIEHTGNDLQKLTKETDKILLNLSLNQGVEEIHVEKFVGISKDFNVFELQKAIGRRNFAQSLAIVNYMGKNIKKNPIQPLVIILYTFFSKLLILKYSSSKSETELSKILELRPYFLSEYKMAASMYSIPQIMKAIRAIRDTDLMSKGVGNQSGSDEEILQKMLFGIFI